MAESLGALTQNDQKRIKRLLDAFEAGQLNSTFIPTLKGVKYPTPYRIGKMAETIAQSSTGSSTGSSTSPTVVGNGLVTLHKGSTSADSTGVEDVTANDWLGAGLLKGERVPVLREWPTGEHYVMPGCKYDWGFLSTDTTTVEPFGLATVDVRIRGGGSTEISKVEARSVTEDRIEAASSANLKRPFVQMWFNSNRSEWYFKRVGTQRRFFFSGSEISQGPFTSTSVIPFTGLPGTTGAPATNTKAANTTGFELKRAASTGGIDRLIIKDAGIYNFHLSANVDVPTTGEPFGGQFRRYVLQIKRVGSESFCDAFGDIVLNQSSAFSTTFVNVRDTPSGVSQRWVSTDNSQFEFSMSQGEPLLLTNLDLIITGEVYV